MVLSTTFTFYTMKVSFKFAHLYVFLIITVNYIKVTKGGITFGDLDIILESQRRRIGRTESCLFPARFYPIDYQLDSFDIKNISMFWEKTKSI